MSLNASRKEAPTEFELLPAGNHAAVCTWVVDCGPEESEWEGEIKEVEKVKFRFEVPAERVKWTEKDGTEHEGPKIIWATYTNSLSDRAKLRAHLEAWRGRPFTEEELAGFNLGKLLDAACLLNVIHKTSQAGKVRAAIASIAPLVKGMEKPKREGEAIMFDFDSYTADQYDKLPKWLQEIVTEGKRIREMQIARAMPKSEAPKADIADDDIPF